MHKNKQLYILLFFSFHLLSTEPRKQICSSVVPLPQDIITKIMADICDINDIQLIGRVGQTCSAYNRWYHSIMTSYVPANIGDFDACTKALVFHAKEYQKNGNEERLTIFKLLWGKHERARTNGINAVIPRCNSFVDAMRVYAGSCYNQKMIDDMLQEKDTLRLKELLCEENTFGIKTMLLLNQSFDFTLNGYKSRHLYDFKNYDDDSTLDCVCRLSNIAMVMQLLSKSDRNITQDDDFLCEVFESAMKCENSALVDTLFKDNVERLLKKRSVIIYSAIKHSFQLDKIIESLFNNDINIVNETISICSRLTPLHYAVEEGNIYAVRFLIGKGANLNVTDSEGATPLHYAYENSEIVRELLENGADKDAVDSYGRTVLMTLSRHYWKSKIQEIGDLLLEYGADVNMVDNSGKTVLHYYVNDCSHVYSYDRCRGLTMLSMIKKLIQKGVDLHAIDNDGNTAYQYFKDHSAELLNLLCEAAVHTNSVNNAQITLPDVGDEDRGESSADMTGKKDERSEESNIDDNIMSASASFQYGSIIKKIGFMALSSAFIYFLFKKNHEQSFSFYQSSVFGKYSATNSL